MPRVGDPVTFKGQKLENPEFNPANTGGRNGTHQLTYAIANVQGRIAYPTVVYLDSDLNVLAPVQGYLTPEQIEPILNYFGEGRTTRPRITRAFMGTFKGKWTALIAECPNEGLSHRKAPPNADRPSSFN
jgi:hypothetical protein